MHTIDKKKNRSSSIDDQTSEIPNNTTTDIDYSDVNHGGKQAKAKRAKVFASWVLNTFFDIPIMRYTDINKIMICQPCGTDESTNDNKKIQSECGVCSTHAKLPRSTNGIAPIFDAFRNDIYRGCF